MKTKGLNSKLFDLKTKKLKSNIRDKILEIVDTFKEYIEIPINIIDIILVGSNASYNYTDKSDIDIHLVVNFDELSQNTDLVQALFNSKKKSFNETYDITIKGLEAELYVEDINSATISNGIYSILKNCWIKFPKKQTDIKIPDISSLYDKYSKMCIDLLNSSNPTSKDVSDIINSIYMLRKNGLAKNGEYAKGNLVFKKLREQGYLQELIDLQNELISKELSLEHLI